MSVSFTLLLFCSEERILPDFKTNLLEFENASFTFVVSLRKLFVNQALSDGRFCYLDSLLS